MGFRIPLPFRFLASCLFAAAIALPSLLAHAAEGDSPVYKTGRGRLISFQDGKLSLQARNGETLVYHPLPPQASAVRIDREAGKFVPAEAVAALSAARPGEWIQVIVEKGNATIRVGERKQQTSGTFVSFKEDRLMLLLKVTGPSSYVKKYGNLIHFNKFFDGTPVEESVDGEPYQRIGTAAEVLPKVKEGTVITIYGEGDDNITLIQIGVPKKK